MAARYADSEQENIRPPERAFCCVGNAALNSQPDKDPSGWTTDGRTRRDKGSCEANKGPPADRPQMSMLPTCNVDGQEQGAVFVSDRTPMRLAKSGEDCSSKSQHSRAPASRKRSAAMPSVPRSDGCSKSSICRHKRPTKASRHGTKNSLLTSSQSRMRMHGSVHTLSQSWSSISSGQTDFRFQSRAAQTPPLSSLPTNLRSRH